MISFKTLKSILTSLALFAVLSGHSISVLAFDIPSAPTPPPAPSAPLTPSIPEVPSAPTPPPAPVLDPTPTPSPEPTPDATPKPKPPKPSPSSTPIPSPTSNPDDLIGNTQGDPQSQTSSESQGSGNVGDTTIETGDATAGSGFSNLGNTNSATTNSNSADGSISIKNSVNGSGSTNSGSVTVSDTSTTAQTNSANIVNNLKQSAETGDNEANKNVGDSTITTGDANVSGTIVNSVNSNFDGLMISEFNIVDDHNGDIVLDFEQSCIYGCYPGLNTASVTNTGNGSESNNSASIISQNTDSTFQTNDANVENNLILTADSGHNQANKNTNGDSTITTGNANISANAVTLANNNISGQVYYGIVNIYGDLVGDIIFPEEYTAQNPSDITLANAGNGAGSVNTTDYTQTNTDSVSQFNTANINNNLIIDATTGDNEASSNTNGNSQINTGQSNVEAQVLNVANMNLTGGDMWIVLVNEAGKWIGRLLGAPEGANIAVGEGAGWTVDEYGQITITNSDNGADSTNTSSITDQSSSTTVQTNTANIENNFYLNANTGGNQTNKNTGGHNSITTGDANVIANLVNFVNNNISGGGRLFVTTVNVFGTWMGNFITPGHSQEESQALAQTPESELPAIGGYQSTDESVDQDSSPSQSSDSDTSSAAANQTDSTVSKIIASILGTGLTDQPEYISEQVAGSTDLDSSLLNTNNADNEASSSAHKKVFQINLAWFLSLIPASGAYLAARKFWFVA